MVAQFLPDGHQCPSNPDLSLSPYHSEQAADWFVLFWGVYFCPLTIRTNYSPWKQRRETPIYFCIPPSFHLFVSPFPNGEQTPSTPPCLIVHIVIGDISINLVICSWVCLLCFPSSICSFCNYFFFLRFLPMRDFGQKTFPYHSTFSYFLEWFIFQMPCFLFASSLFLNYVWFDHVGWEVSWSWLFEGLWVRFSW